MSAACGVNQSRLFTTVYALASGLAGLAGVLAVPISGASVSTASSTMRVLGTDWVFMYDVAVTAVGSPGVPTSSELVGDEATLDPAPLAAVTVKVYVVPLVNPVTISISAVELNVCEAWAVAPINGVTT